MMRFLGHERAGCRWLPVLGAALAATSLACGTAPEAGWTPEYLELAAAKGDPNQNFGMVFRIRGTWLAALALAGPGDGAPGAVYLFEKDGDSLAIAAPGADTVVLYQRHGDTWLRHQTFENPNGRLRDPKGRTNERGGAFGRTLDLDGDLLVVGALRADGDVPDAGAAFVYRRLDGAWHLEDRLVAPDGATNDMFGHWVAHDGELILSGAFRHRVAGSPEFGAAYLFARRQGDWQLIHQLVVPDQPSRRGSAYTVDLHAGTALLSGGRPGGFEATRESTQAGGLYVVDVSRARP